MAIHRFQRLIGLFLLSLLAVLPASCTDQPAGPVEVVVVGPPPRLVDPRNGPLRAGDALLLQSVAQGLVAFDPGGNVVAGLAERWNVSNDGLSYIFRIAPISWAGGSKVTAEQVARSLRRQIQASSRNALRDPLGAVSEIVAMTDRVIEIRLSAPRPNLLSLLAQPELAILRNGHGTGPFSFTRADGAVTLSRTIEDPETEESRSEQIVLSGKSADQAVAAFVAGKADLVVGGTFADLPLARRVERPRGALRYDPASGLFGLAPGGRGGRFASEDWRALLNRAIDRESFIAALGVPGLSPRATLLEAGLDGLPAPSSPSWSVAPIADRRGSLAAESRTLLGSQGSDQPEIRVFLPEGSGADVLLRQLDLDWSFLGLKTVRAASAESADFVLIDEVAPSSSPAWFARRFRCEVAAACDPEIDELLQSARVATVPTQRYALIAQAAALIDSKALFLPIAAPVRWALVGERIKAFSGNRYARHSLVGIGEDKVGPGAAR